MTGLVRRVLALIDRSAKRRLAVLGVFFLANSILESFAVALLFWLFKLIVDGNAMQVAEVAAVGGWLGLDTASGLVAALCVALFGLFVLKSVLLLATNWVRADMEWSIRNNVSTLLFDGYLRSPYLLHLRRQSMDLYNNVHTSTGHLCQSVVKLSEIASDGLLLLGLTAMMIYLSPWATLIALAIFGLIGCGYVVLAEKHFRGWGQVQRDTAQQLFATVSEALTGIKQIKTLGAEPFFVALYRKRMDRAQWAGVRNTFYGQLLRPVLEVLVVGALLGAVGYMLVSEQSPAQIVPVLALLGATAYRVMPSAARIVTSIQGLQFARSGIDAVYDDITAFREGRLARLATVSTERTRLRDAIRLENVSAQYDETREPVLRNVSLTIRRHESVGLVGTSGAGKTTLVDIILGLITPMHGSVWIDDQQVRPGDAIPPGLFGYVPQETFLIDASIRGNVALGEAEDAIDEARVARALAAASLDAFVASLPQGLDTMVGERGLRLSGGQRQRLAIARAVYRDPDVLVFDEATSSLDSLTEAEVADEMARLHGHKTLIIVAHRLSTLRHCDRLLFLESGRLVDQGSFVELLHRNAIFREMVRRMELAAPEPEAAARSGIA
jgi:ATP-binding cassette subfamily C protein